MESLHPGDPERIDKYQLIGVLGQGGMGRVYLGKSPDNVIVAVKVMKTEFASDSHFVARFRREMQAAEVLGNGYTAALVGCDPEARQPWLATKFIVGGSLGAMVGPTRPRVPPMPLDAGAVWWLAFGLIKALTEIHECGIVHRDLKPANVIMAHDGPKVIDFGVALSLGNFGSAAARLTGLHGRLGTPPFMSPEQLQYDQEIGPPSDIFSLGIVLVYAATGVVLDRDEYGRILWGSAALRSFPGELLPLIQRCLRTRPEDRAELRELLSIVVEGKRSYQQAEPSFWPQPTAARVGRVGDEIRQGLPASVAERVVSFSRDEETANGDTQPLGPGYPPTKHLTETRRARLNGVLYPAYRPALDGSSVFDRHPGQERDATEWAIEGDRDLSAKRWDEAERAYRASLKLDPKNAVVWVDLGRALCPRGRMQEAERAFARALEISPRLIAARRNIYLAVRHMGGSEPAAKLLAEDLREACLAVLELPAAEAEEYANLGDAHFTLGQRAQGAEAYETALRLDSGNPRLQEKYERAAQG